MRGRTSQGMISKARDAFTLIEVMVAVIIIAVVIAAMLQLFSNNTYQLQNIDKRLDDALGATMMLGIGAEGFETQSTTMETLVEGFELDDDLRRRLKLQRVEVIYEADLQLKDDTDDSDDTETEGLTDEAEEAGEGVYLEIGRTAIQHDDVQASLVRLRLTQ